MENHFADALLALIQINVAVGLLYIGLPAARYRNKLHVSVFRIIEDYEIKKRPNWEWSVYSKIALDPAHQDNVNYLSALIYQLHRSGVEEVQRCVPKNLFDLIAEWDESSAEKHLPDEYRRFKRHYDKFSVVFFTFAPSILLALNVMFPTLEIPLACYALAVLVGLLVVVELLSILVYGRPESSGFPADFTLIDSIDVLHVGDDIRQVTKPA